MHNQINKNWEEPWEDIDSDNPAYLRAISNSLSADWNSEEDKIYDLIYIESNDNFANT